MGFAAMLTYLEWSAKHLFEHLGVEAQNEFVDLPSSCSAGDGKVAIFSLLERLFQVVDEIRSAARIAIIAIIGARLVTTIPEVITIPEVTHGGEKFVGDDEVDVEVEVALAWRQQVE